MSLRPKFSALFAAASIALLAACATQKLPPAPAEPKPPVAAMKPFNVESPNGIRVDNYYWLRDDTRKNPEMLSYLKAENAYYATMSAHYKPLEDTLYNEIIGRIKQDDTTVPAKYKNYWYYTRFEEGKEYPIYARKARRRAAPSRSCSTVRRWRPDTTSSRSAAWTSARTNRSSPRPTTPSAAASTRSASRISPPASCCPTS